MRRVAGGARLSVIEVPGDMNRGLSGAGTLRDAPLLDDWRLASTVYRRKALADWSNA